MARIIYSGLVTSINGSIGGTTFQRNRYGATAKNKPLTINPNTVRQNQIKSLFQLAIAKWKGLTSVQRASWNSWAATFPQPTRLNANAYLNGFNCFARWHITQGISFPNLTLTSPAFALDSISNFGATVTNSAGVLDVFFSYTESAPAWRVNCFASGGINDSSYVTRAITYYMNSPALTSSPQHNHIENQYTPIFGALPPVGSSIVVAFSAMNAGNGQVVLSPPIKCLVS